MALPKHSITQPADLASSDIPRSLSRRHLLSGVAAMAASAALTGCGASLTRSISAAAATATLASPPQIPSRPMPKTVTSTPQPVPSGALTPATLAIASNVVATLAPNFLGFAYEKQSLTTPLFSASNADLVGLFQRLGPCVLQVGGASVDQCVWTANGAGLTPGQIAPADVDALAAFLRVTGWSCIYGVNLGGAATGATSPALAAAEVAYVAQQLGDALLDVQLGNACETYGSSFFAGNWSVEIFESLWQQFRAAIVAAAPSVSFAGPAAASNVYGWTLPFGEYVTRSEINLLTQEYTTGAAADASVDGLVAPDPALATELLELHYGAQSIDVPFRLDGCAAYEDGGVAGVSDAYASALWAIDTLFQSALGGASGVHFKAGGQQPCTPIADNHGAVIGPTPIFYGLLLSSLAGDGTMLATQLSAASLNVTAYAVQSAAGGMSVVIVNKDATQNLDLSVTLPQQMTAASLQQMAQLSAGASAPSLSALDGVTLQSASVLANGIFAPAPPYPLTLAGTQLSCYVPALSAVLIQLS
ncbi:MAG: hypothetical protein WBY53_04680 [Acidobacteriaceae bacterium]